MTNQSKYAIIISTDKERGNKKMANAKFYWFTFEDGYRVAVRGFSKQELRVEEYKHGKLISKVLA